MRLRDIARDRETQARAARFTVARGLEPAKRLEHPLQRFLGEPGPSSDTLMTSAAPSSTRLEPRLPYLIALSTRFVIQRLSARGLASTGVCAFPSMDTLEPSSAYSAASAISLRGWSTFLAELLRGNEQRGL